MNECPSLNTCSFVNVVMRDSEDLVGIFKSRYCNGDNSQCARFKIASSLGKEFVPGDLYPNELERAMDILNSYNNQ